MRRQEKKGDRSERANLTVMTPAHKVSFSNLLSVIVLFFIEPCADRIFEGGVARGHEEVFALTYRFVLVHYLIDIVWINIYIYI